MTSLGSQISIDHPPLGAFPLLQRLEKATEVETLQRLERIEFSDGEVIISQEEDPDKIYFLTRGEAAVTRRGKSVALLSAPRAFGLLAVVDNKERSAQLSAVGNAEVYALKRADFERLMRISPAVTRNVIEYFASEVRLAYERNDQLLSHFEDFFETPNAQLVPGPYVADPFRMYIFLMRDDPAKLRRLLPPGLTVIPGFEDRYLLTYSFFERVYTENPLGAGKVFSYNETCPFIPCVGPGLRPGAFAPELYPDNFLAITLGREMYGFPKRFGLTDRMERNIDFTLDGRLTVRAAWEAERPVPSARFAKGMAESFLASRSIPKQLAGLGGLFFRIGVNEAAKQLWPAVNVFLHKQILDESSERERCYDVDELVKLPFEVTAMDSFRELSDPAVSFLDRRFLLGGQCLWAGSLRMGFRFGRGTRLIDYAQPVGLRAKVRQAMRGIGKQSLSR